jgi:serine/threonine protein kinase
MSILNPGDELRTATGLTCRVERFLGSGGQGEVHQGALQGVSLAIKWYYPTTATAEQQALLSTMIEIGAPHPRFLWPIDLVTRSRSDGFGYLMALREPRFKCISDLLRRKIHTNFRCLAIAGEQLAGSFLPLHAKGLCYRDISHGNVFFDPANGDILVCDNDNVAVESQAAGVQGTPRFMAPEIVRGEAKPSAHTDLFSLAILLFLMLVNHHPLEGRREADIHCFDLPAMKLLYGTEPVFIFDPADTSNRPVPGMHGNALAFWPIYPGFLRELFTRSFTEGLRDPAKRVRESEWRTAMFRLIDWIVYCPSCGAQCFYDSARRAGQAQGGSCWSCRAPLVLPPRLRLGKSHLVMLNHDTKLYERHLDSLASSESGEAVAEVSRHPSDPRRWGLKNLSNSSWTATLADGSSRTVELGRSVGLTPGVRIDFGKLAGEIEVG